jgi:hypothetical protein
MAAQTENAPSTQGSSEPPQTSAKTRRRFLDRITGGYRYRIVYWIIALIAFLLVADLYLAEYGIVAYESEGWFNPTTGQIRVKDKIYGLTFRTTYHDSFWTPIAKEYLPPEMKVDKWFYISGTGYSLQSGMHGDGIGCHLMVDGHDLLDMLSSIDFTPEAKREAIVFYVKTGMNDNKFSYLREYAGRLQDGTRGMKEPISAEVVRTINEEFINWMNRHR